MEKQKGEQVSGYYLADIKRIEDLDLVYSKAEGIIGKATIVKIDNPNFRQDRLKEIFMNPDSYKIPLPGTDYHQYFMGVDPATGEDKVFLQLDTNNGAIPLPRHLWEKKAPKKPMLIIEPLTQEQLEADFRWRMMKYELSQNKAPSLAVCIAFAAGIVFGLIIIGKLLFS